MSEALWHSPEGKLSRVPKLLFSMMSSKTILVELLPYLLETNELTADDTFYCIHLVRPEHPGLSTTRLDYKLKFTQMGLLAC